MLSAYRREKAKGRDHPLWLQRCRAFGDWLLGQRRANGGFPRAWKQGTPDVVNTSTLGSYFPIPLLVKLAEATGEKRFLAAAIQAGHLTLGAGTETRPVPIQDAVYDYEAQMQGPSAGISRGQYARSAPSKESDEAPRFLPCNRAKIHGQEILRLYFHRHLTCYLLSGCLAVLIQPQAGAQRGPAAQPNQASGTAAQAEQSPIPPETNSVTDHEITLGGKVLRYKATAGNLLISGDDEKPYGSVFFVAYTLADAPDPRTRPLTFLYNGGPGSASMWLHMGSVAPVRVVTASPEATGSAPYQLIPNQYSLLDKTDLVFVDAVGTGYSRPVGRGAIRDFAGTDQDVQAFSRFIQRYISVNRRWNSPKFLFGESYGTTRSAALADVLENAGVSLNGIVLMSTILNYFTMSPGSDAVYIGNLPSYAAIAWHYGKVAHKPADEKAFLNEVRAFARGAYAEALAQGHNLPQAQVDSVAAKLASYTGLSATYIKESNLRISPTRFRKELLRDQRMIIGRYDARFEGSDVDAAGETPGYDPSSTGITGAFVSALHDYMEGELKYSSKETYYPSGPNINQSWDHTHRVGGAGGGGGGGRGAAQALRDAYVAGDLADAMRKNPKLKVLSVNGLFDLATPFFITEFDLSHMQLEPRLRENIEFKYYHSGHMIYLNVDELKQLKTDLADFYTRAVPGGLPARPEGEQRTTPMAARP
jgi:carboxypeptidase C (cathepsin A)